MKLGDSERWYQVVVCLSGSKTEPYGLGGVGSLERDDSSMNPTLLVRGIWRWGEKRFSDRSLTFLNMLYFRCYEVSRRRQVDRYKSLVLREDI